MYYTNIANEELKAYHNTEKVTANYTELNDLENGALFDKSKQNTLIPKFYSDEITGSDNVKIMDNKAVLYINDSALSDVYFSSVENDVKFGVYYEFASNNYNSFLMLHFYNNDSLFNLNDFEFTIENNSIDLNEKMVTDKYGNCFIQISENTGVFTIKGSQGQVFTFGDE